MFINTARAEIIEPGALLSRLQRGDIPAALDVFDHEPLAVDDPLCSIPGIILTHTPPGVPTAHMWASPNRWSNRSLLTLRARISTSSCERSYEAV